MEVTEDRTAWADTIRLERHRRRLKQDDVAHISRLDQGTVSRAESGIGSDQTYRAIARALGVELPKEPS